MLPADLLDRLLPDTTPTERWEEANPPRELPAGAEVTRFAPSPTGFIHIGGVYTATVAKELAERSGGSYLVRIEDTDQARAVEGSDAHFARAFDHFGIGPTEAPDAPWGPYRQSERAEIYRSFVRALLGSGHAYPDFATKEELAGITERQQAAKADLGYWGEWAVWRDADPDRVAAALDAGQPFTIRFRAPDEPGRVAFDDAIRGRIEADDNRNDAVLLKSSAEPLPLPTYHLAHAVDDHLMRVTLVLRGDEWISSVPLHLQLFDALGFERVRYAHVAPLMKGEGKSRRKLSKRKDPEASVDYWMAEGYPVGAVRHYLRGLANSRLADLPFDEAAAEPLRLEEFGASGPLVDIPKLDDISADYVAQMPAADIRDRLLAWADEHDPELAGLLRAKGDALLDIIDVDRVDTDRVRKDIVKWSVFRDRYGFFFPELFELVDDPADERFLGVPPGVVSAFAADFVSGYDADTAAPTWFDQVRGLAERHGFALDRKAHKADPDAYHGTMREASNIVRVTLTGSGQSPSLDQIAGVLGADEVRRRVGARGQLTAMDLSPDSDHDAIAEAVEAVCARFDDAYWSDLDQRHEFPWDFYRAMAEGGWVGICIPEQYGGGGQGIAEGAIVLNRVAASGACMNGSTALHLTMFGLNPVVRFGSDRLKDAFLPRAAAGELHVAFGVTEPDAGTDTSRIATRAVDDGRGGFVVSGRKIWTSKALESEVCLLLARTDGSPGSFDGLSLFLVDLDPAHCDIAPIPKVGRNAVASCEVAYDELPVEGWRLVGERGQGFRHILHGLNPERILLAAMACGIGEAALRRAVAYAGEREVFGRPIGANQAIAHPLAQAHMQLTAAKAVMREAAWRYDHDLPCGEHANTAKYLAAEASWFAADQAVQTHGGLGYATEYHVERYWREARLQRLAPVSQEMTCNFIAQNVLGLPRSY